MTLNKLIQLRQGVVSMKIFRDEVSGRLLFSLDKDMGSRRLMGPLFAEDELYQILDIMLDYDEWESGAFHGKPNRRAHRAMAAASEDAVRGEIAAAIGEVKKVATTSLHMESVTSRDPASIQVLPSLPEYTYIHTCPKCSCHVTSQSILPGNNVLSLCGWCGYVYHIGGG